jgi:hypothetical protein
MTTFAAPMVRDELDGVVSTLCNRFPHRVRVEIVAVVAEVYAELAAKATVTAHLIPLTLNRTQRLLSNELPEFFGAAGAKDECLQDERPRQCAVDRPHKQVIPRLI